MQQIIPALIKAKKNFKKISKDAVNPYFKSRYATLDAVLDATENALAEKGLTIVQVVEGYTLQTFLYHESGEFLQSNYPLPETTDSQKLGAAITYARRYAICAMLSIIADEDDDGNHSSSTKSTSNKPQKLVQNKVSQNARVSQNERVKKICALLDYPLELARQWLHQNNFTNFNSLSDEVVDGFVRSICWQWASQNGYPVEEFGCVANGSGVEGVKRWRDELIEFSLQQVS
ncbi:ERF family protein [Mastigocoleus testarum]|nr:ERF family protein [Mastigocoleus testarum]